MYNQDGSCMWYVVSCAAVRCAVGCRLYSRESREQRADRDRDSDRASSQLITHTVFITYINSPFTPQWTDYRGLERVRNNAGLAEHRILVFNHCFCNDIQLWDNAYHREVPLSLWPSKSWTICYPHRTSTLYTLSYLAEIERRDDPETVFVVPGHMNLTLRQMDIILLAGQQPGVPFRLGASGAQRPQVKSWGIVFRMGQLVDRFPIYIAHVLVTNLLMCSETHHMTG